MSHNFCGGKAPMTERHRADVVIAGGGSAEPATTHDLTSLSEDQLPTGRPVTGWSVMEHTKIDWRHHSQTVLEESKISDTVCSLSDKRL